MAQKFYTILVLPDATSTSRKFHISKRALTAVSVVAVFTILSLGFFFYQYVNLNVHLLELKQLRYEAGVNQALAEKVGRLESELTRVRDLDRRIRTVVGLEDPEGQASSSAQGGAETVSRTALLEALKQRTGRLMDWVNRDLLALGQEISSRERSMRELKTFIEEKASVLGATPTVLPVNGLVTAGYGYRKSPFTGGREFHEGLDISAPYGTPIVATADGTVTFSGPLAGYGNTVFIDHGHGFATFYAHNSSHRVREGQRVRRGELIAYVGTTGRTTGPHVHYEVHVNGVISNPLKYAIDTSNVRFAGDVEVEKANPS